MGQSMNEWYRWEFVVRDGLGSYIWGVTAQTLEEAQEAARADCGSHVSLNQVGHRKVCRNPNTNGSPQ